MLYSFGIIVSKLKKTDHHVSPFLIAVAGGSGSGKTTLAQQLLAHFPSDSIAYIKHDSYYRQLPGLNLAKRAKVNYDHPDSLETELLIAHLRQLLGGEPIAQPVYDYTMHNRTDKTIKISPKPVIIIEGILVLADLELRSLFDLKVFVDTEADVRVLRRLQRDVAERGRTFEFGIKQYLGTTKPMHDQFVEPSKKFADLIIPEGGLNQQVIDLLCSQINKLLHARHH